MLVTQELANILRASWSQDLDVPPQELWQESDWLALWQVREHLVVRALESAKNRAKSWRDFRVGASAFLSSKDPDLLKSLGRPAHHIFTGANNKKGEHLRNTCAEQQIVAQIGQQEHLFFPKEVLALVVAGDPLGEPDRESGLLTASLHPCNHCRRELRDILQISPTTLIVCVNLANTAREIFLFQELLELHGLTYTSGQNPL